VSGKLTKMSFISYDKVVVGLADAGNILGECVGHQKNEKNQKLIWYRMVHVFEYVGVVPTCVERDQG
jgi:hypothetical protein